MRNFLKQFKGQPLNNDQIVLGIYLSFRNSNELFEDAELLKRHKRYARALSLAILSLEELSKVILLIELLFNSKKDDLKWKKWWRAFTSHQFKQLTWGTYKEYSKEKLCLTYKDNYPTDFQPLLEKFKELGFYVSFVGKPLGNKFIEPNDFVKNNLKWLEWIFRIVKQRIDMYTPATSSMKKSKRFAKVINDIVNAYHSSKNRTEAEKAIKMILLQAQKDWPK